MLVPATAEAKNGKVTACVTKQKVMTFSKRGKCKKGERKITWNKAGKQGPAGAAGQTGAAGAQGPAGSAAGFDQLQDLVEQQGETIAQLTAELAALGVDVDDLTGQLTGLSGDFDTLCTQVSAVTDQSDGLLAVLDAINDLLDPLVILPVPGLPDPLGAFSCAS